MSDGSGAVRGDVHVAWRVPPAGLDDAAAVAAARAALARGGRPGLELSLAFVSDDELAALHASCLGDPTPTDVLSFDLGADEEAPGEFSGPGGEVVVSVDRARAVAAERGAPLARELALYVVHGCLHLCGFDDRDDDERAAMREAERAVLADLGFAPDDAPHDA